MTNDKFPMTNQVQMTNDKKNYNLSERTGKFGMEIIIFVKSIKENNINRSIINQLVRSATSIGANYMEADCAESKKDFNHKIRLLNNYFVILSGAIAERKIYNITQETLITYYRFFACGSE